MQLISYFSENHAQLLYLIAGISILIELTVMGLSGPLFFFAIAALLTGMLTHVGLLESWQMELVSLAVITSLLIFLLWKPLKKYQNQGTTTDTSSDMINKIVPCMDAISAAHNGSIRYSGINWPARLSSSAGEASIQSGENCQIVAVEGNVMIVDKV